MKGLNNNCAKKIKRLIKDLNQLVAVAEITNEKFIWSVGRKTTRFPILKVKESALPKNTQTIDLKIDQKFTAVVDTDLKLIFYAFPKPPDRENVDFTLSGCIFS